MKLLIVIDMQVDFVNGSLGTKEAELIVPYVKEKIQSYEEQKNPIIFTRDTHFENYMDTLEGKMLPVIHCIENTKGHQIVSDLSVENHQVIDKVTFGYKSWEETLKDQISDIDEIELCGLCTDICVISNALILRALYPNMKMTVDSKACAGVTVEKHLASLEVMRSCQIEVI